MGGGEDVPRPAWPLERVNAWLHAPFVGDVAWYLFWAVLMGLGGPVFAVGLLVMLAYELLSGSLVRRQVRRSRGHGNREPPQTGVRAIPPLLAGAGRGAWTGCAGDGLRQRVRAGHRPGAGQAGVEGLRRLFDRSGQQDAGERSGGDR
jgi:hypothetical protein